VVPRQNFSGECLLRNDAADVTFRPFFVTTQIVNTVYDLDKRLLKPLSRNLRDDIPCSGNVTVYPFPVIYELAKHPKFLIDEQRVRFLKLLYLRARYYDPTAGRFIGEDPIRFGPNFYNYANNSPLKLSPLLLPTWMDLESFPRY
jgi:RHS repeat-associated protein